MRTTKLRRFCLLASAAVIAAPALASAQQAVRPVTFGLQAGFTMPTGDYKEVAESGWNAGGYVQWRPERQVFGLRGEVQYHRNDMTDEVILDNGGIPGETTGNFSLTYVGVAPVLEVAPAGSSVGWYVLAGVGLYRVGFSISEGGIDVSSSSNEFGFNAGAGLRFRFGAATLFAEARYHGVQVDDDDPSTSSSNFTFMPFSVGISW
jgi:opacity protein-like surface antigen